MGITVLQASFSLVKDRNINLGVWFFFVCLFVLLDFLKGAR